MSRKGKTQIALSSFNKKVLLEACEKILSVVSLSEEQITMKGPIPLPTRRRIYCVLRSPHVDKDSREQFEIRRYKRIFELVDKSVQTVETLRSLELPPGVAIQIHVDDQSS